jgi:hypothetical protein
LRPFKKNSPLDIVHRAWASRIGAKRRSA